MDKKIIVFIGILSIFANNLSAYSLEILNNEIIYFYKSTESIPIYLIIICAIALIYLIFSFFVLEHLITAIFTLGIAVIIYSILLYEEESKHVFDIQKKVYYRLISDNKSPKNYIKFTDISSVSFGKVKFANPRGRGYFKYGVYLVLENGKEYELYSSRKNKDVIQVQGEVIAKYIEKPYTYK